MATNVEYRRKFRARLCLLWQIKISRDVKMRATLEMQFLDAEAFVAFDHAGHLRWQPRAFRHRPQSERFEILLTRFATLCLPLHLVRDAVEKLRIQPARFLPEKIVDHRRTVVRGRKCIGSEALAQRYRQPPQGKNHKCYTDSTRLHGCMAFVLF